MKSDTAAAGEELDLIRIYIWVMAAMTVALCGVLWYTKVKLDRTEKLVATGQRSLKKFSTDKEEIVAMLGVFESNKEDEARRRPMTWFSRVWQQKQIPEGSIRPEAWDSKYFSRGNFDEERITLKFDNKKTMSRAQIGGFCHEIERSSQRLRIIELKLSRDSRRKEGLGDSDWYGEVMVGYRKARIRD